MPLTDAELGAALDALGPEPLPPTFVAATMARLTLAPRPRPVFLDYALPIFATLSGAVAFLILPSVAATLDPLLFARLELQYTLAWSALLPTFPAPNPLVALVALLALGAMTITLLADRPRLTFD